MKNPFTSLNLFSAILASSWITGAQESQALVIDSTNGPLTVSNSMGTVRVELPQAGIRLGGSFNSTSPFQISLNYFNPPSPSEAAAFEAAKAVWEGLITGWKETVGISSVTIDVNLSNIDGAGGILGSAGPTTGVVTTNFLYASSGSMTFDTSDIPSLGSVFSDVVLHEMGHVLGIGTLWSASAATGGAVTGRQELYINNSGQYTGAFGVAAYTAEFGQDGAFVPVELGGGPGTANGHWNEVDGGGQLTGIVGPGGDLRNELMTGWLDAPLFISNTTIQSMQDLGFNVVPEPASATLLAFGCILIVRRRS